MSEGPRLRVFLGRRGSFWAALPLRVLHPFNGIGRCVSFSIRESFLPVEELVLLSVVCVAYYTSLLFISDEDRQSEWGGGGSLSVAFGEGTESEAKFYLPPQLSLYHDSR